VSPIWSPDSTRIVFGSDRDGAMRFFVKNLGDAAPEAPFFQSPALFKDPMHWSADGRWITFVQLNPTTAQDVLLIPGTGNGNAVPIVQGPTQDLGGWISPDGRWVAYASADTGRFELYVQPFPTPGPRVQVSAGGGGNAWWTRDGRALVYLGNDGRTLWRVGIEPGSPITIGTPVQMAMLPQDVAALDAMPDRQRFLALMPEHAGTGSVMIVQNWQKALEQNR
jgi:Tol biopolymer transport system component